MVTKRHRLNRVLFSLFLGASLFGAERGDPLSYTFTRHYGQVEVGGRYVGAEFHGSRPIPSRISFYEPAANSIDVSTDYWARGNSLPLAIAISSGAGTRRWIGREAWDYTLHPHWVSFTRREGDLDFRMTYEFCINQPAMVATIVVTNRSAKTLPLELYTHLLLTLRTCQTYARKESAWTEHVGGDGAIVAHFDDPETRKAAIFVLNAATLPIGWTSDASELGLTDTGTSAWIAGPPSRLRQTLFPQSHPGKPAAVFVYRKEVQPSDSLVIVQVIGSCAAKNMKRVVSLPAGRWRKETAEYNRYVTQKAEREAHFITGDPVLDRSAIWARGLIAANAHSIGGHVVPMPCPAEYNFFFTHDVLLTDLGAMNFDLPRVKRDLLYIASLSRDNVIPHAYYWRDKGFQTEFCGPDNWNHLWFILATAGYYRHSMDRTTARRLFPLVQKSIELILTQRKGDGLMYAKHPDWWDIGNREGPRAYLTILTARALREFVYLSAALGGKGGPELLAFERTADSLQQALGSRLWSSDQNFLTNFNGTDPDRHFYAGSLLGPVYGLLDAERSALLLKSAEEQLVDQRIGVRIVAPADFHTDSVIAYFHLAGNEAGAPYVYANGGVWPHTTAWYILALQACGKSDEAVNYFRRTMSLDGIADSPMGQPAMYEYRYADTSSPEFGKIDKPSFLWAGGFYLQVLYRLFGISENEWNLSVAASRPSGHDSVTFSLAFRGEKNVLVRGEGEVLRSSVAGGKTIASLVLPLDAANAASLRYTFGSIGSPYLARVNALLNAATYDEKRRALVCTISSFEGHRTEAEVVGLGPAEKIMLDGREIVPFRRSRSSSGNEMLDLRFDGAKETQTLTVFYGKRK